MNKRMQARTPTHTQARTFLAMFTVTFLFLGTAARKSTFSLQRRTKVSGSHTCILEYIV